MDDHPTTDHPAPVDGPEPVGAIAARILDNLATRQSEALARLARAHRRPFRPTPAAQVPSAGDDWPTVATPGGGQQ